MFTEALVFSVDTAWASEMRHYLCEEAGPDSHVDIETDPFRAMQIGKVGYDLLVLDMTIPGFDGSQLLLMLRHKMPAARYVAVSKEGGELDQFQAIQNGADAFFPRAESADDFEQLINHIYHLMNPGPSAPTSTPASSKEEVRVLDLVSVECLSGNSTLFHLTGGEHSGDIFIYQGEIYHAQCPGATGEEAFFEILAWPPADLKVSTHKLTSIPPHTIDRSWKELTASGKDDMVLKKSTQRLFEPRIGKDTVQLAKEVAMVEAPSLTTGDLPMPGELPDPSGPLPHLTQTGSFVKPEERFHADSLISYWAIDLMGEITEGDHVSEAEHAASTTFGLYRQLADIAVVLESDYFDRCTILGHTLHCEVVADNLSVRQAVFDAGKATEEERRDFVGWCYGQSL